MDRVVLETVLSRLPELAILSIGDFFLDKYLDIDRSLEEISIETGLPAHQVVGKRSLPGAAGVVTANMKAIGVGEVICLGAIGVDGEGFELKKALEAIGARTDQLIEGSDIFTPTYTKPMQFTPGQPASELSRLDIKNRKPLPKDVEGQIIKRLRELVPKVQGVAISDQVQERNCGVITDRVREEIASLAKANPNIFFLVDSRVRIDEFSEICVKPNKFEAARAAGMDFGDEPTVEQAKAAGVQLAKMTARPVFVTAGEAGIIVVSDGSAELMPTIPVTGEIDICGAGDSTSAGIVAARSSGASYQDSAAMGNLVASVTVTKIGQTGTASPEELRAAITGS
jgi:rfaE bifunctional protein kinase chain/domain